MNQNSTAKVYTPSTNTQLVPNVPARTAPSPAIGPIAASHQEVTEQTTVASCSVGSCLPSQTAGEGIHSRLDVVGVSKCSKEKFHSTLFDRT